MLYFESKYLSRLFTKDVLNLTIPARSTAFISWWSFLTSGITSDIEQVSPSASLVAMKAGYLYFVGTGKYVCRRPSVIKFHGGGRWSGEYCYMTLLTRDKTKDSPYFQMKIIILIALRGVKFPEGGWVRPPPSLPPWIRP